MRRSLGLAVFAGMCGVTLFGIFLTPVFYYVIQWVAGSKPALVPPAHAPAEEMPTPISENDLDRNANGGFKKI
jgi:multidrug efflux pump